MSIIVPSNHTRIGAWVNSKYCTIPLIAMQGYHTNTEDTGSLGYNSVLTFSVLVANLKKLLYTVANPARCLLSKEKKRKRKSLAAPPPHAARSEKIK